MTTIAPRTIEEAYAAHAANAPHVVCYYPNETSKVKWFRLHDRMTAERELEHIHRQDKTVWIEEDPTGERFTVTGECNPAFGPREERGVA